MLGIDVAESTVSKYLGKAPRPPSQSWRTFVRNHLHQSIAIDFAVVPTIRFSLLYVCVVLDHGRRRILHVNVTANPTDSSAGRLPSSRRGGAVVSFPEVGGLHHRYERMAT